MLTAAAACLLPNRGSGHSRGPTYSKLGSDGRYLPAKQDKNYYLYVRAVQQICVPWLLCELAWH